MRVADYVRFSWSSLLERKGRTLGAIAGLIVAVIALGCALGMSEGFKTYFMESFAQVFGVNVVYVIPLNVKITDVEVSLVESIPYVDTVIPIAFTRGYAIIQGKPKFIYIVGIEPDKLPRLLGASRCEDVVHDGRFIMDKGMVLVGYWLAYTQAGERVLEPGQKISITSLDGVTRQYTISGVLTPFHPMIYGNPNIAVFMTTESFFKDFSRSRQYSFMLVHVKSVKHVDDVVRLLREVFPGAEVFELGSVIRSFMRFFTSFELFSAFIAGISLLIVGLWIFDTMTISVIQRTREFGILKVIGFTGRQIAALVMTEVVVLTIMGVSIGYALLYFIKDFVVLPLPGGYGLVKPILTPTISAFVIVVPFATNMIAAVVPAHRASRVSAAQALRYE